jgi:membrane-associated phospholipid phosphatase
MSQNRGYLGESLADLRALSALAANLAKRYRLALAAILFLVLGIAAALWPYDMDLLASIRHERHSPIHQIARQISFWGDYHTGSLIIFASLWLAGYLRRCPRLRMAALACLLAVSAAGFTSDVFRYGLGRARPNSGYPDGLYGPSSSSRFHSLPSGHSTTSFATAIPLAVLFPGVAVPVIAVAGGVAWSRLELNFHRPGEVLIGAGLGSSFGLVVGFAARRRLRQILAAIAFDTRLRLQPN